jgi:hypothetical protein
VPVVPVPGSTVAPEPVVVAFVVLLTTGPVAEPVRMPTVNWSVSAARALPRALVSLNVGGLALLAMVQVILAPTAGTIELLPV